MTARARDDVDLRPYGRITSLVVARSGVVVHEQYGQGDVETLRNTRSCTKTVLGMIVGIAVERALISGVSATLRELLPERDVDPEKAEITIEQLITMQSSLDCDDWNQGSPGNEELMYPTSDWAQFALDLPLRTERGFRYCTAGVVLAGVAVAAALGESLSAFARHALFPAAGVENYDWPAGPDGHDSAAGGLRLTSRGLLGLGGLYLDGGRGAIPSSWVKASTMAHARIDAQTEYGYLWWLRDFDGQHSYYMTGMGGNRVHVFPELDLVAVITTANFDLAGAHRLSDELLVREVLGRYGS